MLLLMLTSIKEVWPEKVVKIVNYLARLGAQRVKNIGNDINSRLKTRQIILSGFPWLFISQKTLTVPVGCCLLVKSMMHLEQLKSDLCE